MQNDEKRVSIAQLDHIYGEAEFFETNCKQINLHPRAHSGANKPEDRFNSLSVMLVKAQALSMTRWWV